MKYFYVFKVEGQQGIMGPESRGHTCTTVGKEREYLPVGLKHGCPSQSPPELENMQLPGPTPEVQFVLV